MALLSCRGLTRRPFFEGKNLDLEAGEIVALGGPTGSGKTLYLRAIADLDPCDAGVVTLDGVPRSEIAGPEWRSRVLYVHQSGVRLPGTVHENLARIGALTAQQDRASAFQVGVEGLDPQGDAERLSGGEAQALALGRAFACSPRVLLLDESTSAMDEATAAPWEARVRAFASDGGAVLWVAHDGALPDRVGARRERFP